MITALRLFFIVVLVSMLGGIAWASNHTALWELPAQVGGHPWFIATLLDVYWGFLIFFCWLAYRERSWVARAGWLVALILLGNVATATYMLILLFKLPRTATVPDILLRPA